MSLWKRRDAVPSGFPNPVPPSRAQTGRGSLSTDQALRQSAAFACLRLRADLVSLMPVDVFRRVDGVQVEQPKPQVLVQPDAFPLGDWLWRSQFDLDSVGNAVGIVVARDAMMRPQQIELVDLASVSIRGHGPVIDKWVIGTKEYDPADVWHERQYPRSGQPLGMSPLAFAGRAIAGYLAAQDFALGYYDNGGIPLSVLKNVQKTLTPTEAKAVKDRFMESQRTRQPFVTGEDWEFHMVELQANDAAFIEEMRFSVADTCRFLGVPADMIDAGTSGSSVTYANVTQRNTQLLVTNLGRPVKSREDVFSARLLPAPRYAKLNTDAVMRMDLKSRYDAYKVAVDGRWRAPSELRALDNLPPFTPEQVHEFEQVGLNKVQAAGGQPATGGAQ